MVPFQWGAESDAGAASTPKSQTYKFSPSSRISASAYSPGGSGALNVNLYTSGATSHRWIEISFRSFEISCPNRLRMDSSKRLCPFTVARTNVTSGPSTPCRLLRSTVESTLRAWRRFAQVKLRRCAREPHCGSRARNFNVMFARDNWYWRKNLLQNRFLVGFLFRADLPQPFDGLALKREHALSIRQKDSRSHQQTRVHIHRRFRLCRRLLNVHLLNQRRRRLLLSPLPPFWWPPSPPWMRGSTSH